MGVRGGSNDATLPNIATETIGTDQGQVIRLDKGAGTTRVPVIDSDGLPIEGVAGGTPVPVSGTVAVSNPTINPETGLSKTVDVQAVRDRLPAALDADGGAKTHVQNFPASQAVTGPVTDAQLRATAVPVSAASLPLPAGAAAETTLAAQSAKLPATLGQKAMAASMAVAIASDQSGVPVTGPLTDAQIRATALPVSGTVTASGPLTDAQLRATSVPVATGLTQPTTPADTQPTRLQGMAGTVLATVTTVGTTAVAVVASALSGRKSLVVKADAANAASIFLGGSAVTADGASTGGIDLLPGDGVDLDLAAAATLYARSTAAGQLLRVMEIS